MTIMTHQLPELPYAYNALEPFIDAKTMKVHHTKHHRGYVDKFNAAIKGTMVESDSIEEILSSISGISGAIRNNGGAHYNHSLFWSVLTPNGTGAPNEGGKIAAAIDKAFGSFDAFKQEFAAAAAAQFGSGWTWLIVNDSGGLEVTSTPNQDNPLMDEAEVKGVPILGLDVWEHAYYLHYQNLRTDYIEAFWNVVNWEAVEQKFLAVKSETVEGE
jgi:superoxide dismutase, Fe-Mn family